MTKAEKSEGEREREKEKEAEEEERNASIGEFRDGAKDEINLLPPASFRPVVGPGGGVRGGGCARLRGESSPHFRALQDN